MCSCSLWLNYLGKMMVLKVKLTFYPTLLSMWIMAMPSISALSTALARYSITKVVCWYLIFLFLLQDFWHRLLIHCLLWNCGCLPTHTIGDLFPIFLGCGAWSCGLTALIPIPLLGWEIHSEIRGILWLIQFRTFWTLEISLEFYFSDRKMRSRQFWNC